MRSGLWAVAVAASVATVAAQQDAITRYCVSCHSDRLKTSGVTLEKADQITAYEAKNQKEKPWLWKS